MHILYVTARFPMGPGEEFVGTEVEALQEIGVEVTLHPTRARLRDLANYHDYGEFNLTHLPSIGFWPTLKGLQAILMHFLIFVQAVRCFLRSPKHLIRNMAILPNAIRLGLWCRRFRPDHIHAHWLTTSATTALIASMVSGCPFSITAHRGDIVNGNLARAKAGRAEFIRFISRSGLNLFKELHAPDSGIGVIVRMGVRSSDNSCPLNLSPNSRLRIAVPASLREVKGHKYLLQALATRKDLKDLVDVDLLGDGPLRSYIEAQIEALSLQSSVRLIGHINHTDLLERYNNGTYDAVVLPSVDLGDGVHEGIPVSLMEAMSRGVVPIATDTGGIGELVQDGENGLLVQHSDPAAIADAIERLIGDHERFRRLSSNAIRTVDLDFSVAETAKTLSRLFATGPRENDIVMRTHDS